MQIVRDIVVERPAEEVWDLVARRFGDVASWASMIADSRPLTGPGPGDAPVRGRACSVGIPGVGDLTEELVDYDDEARRLTYRATTGMPPFVRTASNTWTVEALAPGTSRFTMHASVDLTPVGSVAAPALRLYLGLVGRRTARDLKTFAEDGGPDGLERRSWRQLDLAVGVNAGFSALSGLALVAAADFWACQFGGAAAVVPAALGTSLVGYGVALGVLVSRGVPTTAGRVIALLDAAWVAGSIGVLAALGQRFTTSGVAATLVASLAVGILGIWQWAAARRTGSEDAGTVPVSRADAVPQSVTPRGSA